MQQGTLEVAGLAMQRENLAIYPAESGVHFPGFGQPAIHAHSGGGRRLCGAELRLPDRGSWPPAATAPCSRCISRIAPTGRCTGCPVGREKLASIAGILTLDPELILMDEPSAALDPKNRRNLIEILRGLPCAMLIASHDLDFIYDTCGRVVLLYEGRIAADGPAEEILHDGALLADCDLELPLRFQSI